MNNTQENTPQEKPLEKAFRRLEEIKLLIQAGNINLDDIVPLAEEASKLKDYLKENIDNAKQMLEEKKED